MNIDKAVTKVKLNADLKNINTSASARGRSKSTEVKCVVMKKPKNKPFKIKKRLTHDSNFTTQSIYNPDTQPEGSKSPLTIFTNLKLE